MIDDLLERGSNKIFADFNDHLRLDFPQVKSYLIQLHL